VHAAYRFRVAFRLDPGAVAVEPDSFETTMRRPADPPGESGWLFFRDNLWRGEIGDPAHLRERATAELGVEVVDVEFRAFECDAEYRTALETEIAANLEEFRAESAREALHKYLGSRIEVLDDGD
jgi:regulator of protease activity HflC (stomatin/prohibitin superfamily)